MLLYLFNGEEKKVLVLASLQFRQKEELASTRERQFERGLSTPLPKNTHSLLGGMDTPNISTFNGLHLTVFPSRGPMTACPLCQLLKTNTERQGILFPLTLRLAE